jgi:hypothetical protein
LEQSKNMNKNKDTDQKPSVPADKSARRELSYDGRGINGPDQYRSRIATFSNDAAGDEYGKLFEAAPELLAALRKIRGTLSQWVCNRLEAAPALEAIGDFANRALDKLEGAQ